MNSQPTAYKAAALPLSYPSDLLFWLSNDSAGGVMSTPDDVNYLLRRAQQEARKAREALQRGDHMMAVYAHRELATRYEAAAACIARELTKH